MVGKSKFKTVATFLTIFEVRMNNLFNFKAKIPALIKCLHRSSQLGWLVSLKRLPCFGHVVQSLLNTCLFWCAILEPTLIAYCLKCRCAIHISNWIGHICTLAAIKSNWPLRLYHAIMKDGGWVIPEDEFRTWLWFKRPSLGSFEAFFFFKH